MHPLRGFRRALDEAAAKIWGRDAEHASRFHSRRGAPCRPSDLLAIPPLLWRRLTGQINRAPWMAPRAVSYLDGLLCADDVLLELGSGASTAWYAGRVGRVVSLEPDARWAGRVIQELRAHPNAAVKVGAVADLFAGALHEMQPTVLIVDHSDEPALGRTDAIRLALESCARLRIIVLDDSDRARYASDLPLSNWSRTRFTGFRGRPLRLTETTVFVRSAEPRVSAGRSDSSRGESPSAI